MEPDLSSGAALGDLYHARVDYLLFVTEAAGRSERTK